MNNIKHEKFLEDIVCRMIENWKNFTWDSKNEITSKFCDYVNEITPIRKVINFAYNFHEFDIDEEIKSEYVGDKFVMFNLNERELVEKINLLIKNVIYNENKFITDFLIDYAEENNFVKNIEEDTINEMIKLIIDVPEAVIIADKNLKKLITDNKLYKDNVDKINKDNICFLDELENCIIQLDFRLRSFDFLNMENIGIGVIKSEYFFVMHDSIDIYSKGPIDEFISVIKT